MKEYNSISPLDLSMSLHPEVGVVVQRIRSFLAQGGFKNNFDPVHGAFPRIVQQDRSEEEIQTSIRRDAARRGMDSDWCDNLESVAKGLCSFFAINKSKWYPLGVPTLQVGDVDVPLTTGGYARKDLRSRNAHVGVVILRSSFPGRTPRDEALRNLGSIIHHTQQRRLRDQLFGAASHRMPRVELLVRRQVASRTEFDHISGEPLELMTEDELERLLTVFLQALDQLGSRRLSVLKEKYGPKRHLRTPDGPTLFDL
jgi:hypothetical protein